MQLIWGMLGLVKEPIIYSKSKNISDDEEMIEQSKQGIEWNCIEESIG